MHILIINSEYPPLGGGAGNASAHIARELEKLGHRVTVITVHFKDLPRKEENSKHFIVHRIPALRRRQERSDALEQALFIISASFWTTKLVRHEKPDAMLAFFGVPSGVVALLLKIIYKIPYIISLRGGDVPGFRPYDFKTYHKLISPLLHIVWKNASAIIANSNGLRELAQAFDLRFDIPIIPNGVDLEIYKSDQRDFSSPYLLSAGRVVYQKGLDLAMRALAGLKDLKWEWRIAGDGPQLDMLKTLAQELGIDDRVVFLGWQSRKELVQQYKKATLFLFPSRHEGMPNAVLEAMASGLPVIATQIAGSEELVVDGKTGILVPSENVEALRTAIHTLLTNAQLVEQMGNASLHRVEEHYSWEGTARQYSILLEQVK